MGSEISSAEKVIKILQNDAHGGYTFFVEDTLKKNPDILPIPEQLQLL